MKKWILIALSSIAVATILVFLFGSRPNETPVSHLAFDSTLWKASNDWKHLDNRTRMVDDLISSKTLIGRERDFVLNLLGAPNVSGRHKMEYEVGHYYSKWNIDPSDELLIKLDEQDRVTSVAVVRARD